MMFRKALFLWSFVSIVPALQGSLFDFRSSPSSARVTHAHKLMQELDLKIQHALEQYQVPGLAIGVVVDGQLAYAKGFGWRDLENKLPVTPSTLFSIGSCTKSFTAFLVGQFVDRGLISWDGRVIDFLPEFRLWDPYATQNLTIRHLLTHRTGMPRHDFMWYNSRASRAEIIQRIRYLEPSTQALERYQYNNLMYLTAGYVLEKMTGKSWEELLSSYILNPLEMKNTLFSVEEMQKKGDFAFPYLDKEGKLKRIGFLNSTVVGPGACLNSNLLDLSHWLQVQMSGGTYKKQALISPATLQEIHAPQVIVPSNPLTKEAHIYSYGIGWSIVSYRGHYFLSHDGGIDGFTSLVGLLPNEGIGIVLLANKNLSSLPRYLSFEMLDRLLDLPCHKWIEEGLSGVQKKKNSEQEGKRQEDTSHKTGTFPSHALEEFVGEYEHPGYGPARIELVEGKLQITFNGITSVLHHWHYDVFVLGEETQDRIVSLEGMKVAFRNGLLGEIEEMAIPFEPTTGDIVFKKKQIQSLSDLSYLRRFTGSYEIYGYTIEIALRGQSLCAIIPSQPIYELIPHGDREFSVKSMIGYTVRFLVDEEDRVQEVLLIQPYGTFSAKPKRFS